MIELKVSKQVIKVASLEHRKPSLPTFPLMRQKYTSPGVSCYGTMTAAEQWGKSGDSPKKKVY